MLELDKITSWITEAIDVLKRNLFACSLLFVVVFAGSLASLGLLAGPLFAGLFIILVRLVEDKRNGVVATPTHPRDLIAGFEFFTNTLLVVCVFIAVVILRAMIFTITEHSFGLFWFLVFFATSLALLFAIPLVALQRLTAAQAIRTSIDVVLKHPGTFAVFMGCYYVVNFVVSYVISFLFWRLGFIAVLFNLVCSWAIGLIFATSLAVAYLEVFGSPKRES